MNPDLILEKTIQLNLSSDVVTNRRVRAMTRSRLPSSPRKQVILASALCALTATLGHAAPLDPKTFTSLGASPFVSGTYEVDTSFDNPAPTIKQGTAVIATGIFYDPTPADTANRDEIAVFTFDTIDLPEGVTLAGVRNANSRPVALLSKDAMTVGGLIDFSGDEAGQGDPDGAPGGAAGPGGGGGGGGGGGSLDLNVGESGSGGVGFVSGDAGEGGPSGAGGAGGSVEPGGGAEDSGGGAFGGNGADGSGARGGKAYGDLTAKLEGGSGGAGSGGEASFGFGGSGGGGGGGAVELGAVSTLSLHGRLTTQGGAGSYNTIGGGGGGAGGGIILHADSIVIDSAGSVDASGGAGNKGGGGGGGRVLIVANAISTAGLGTAVNVAGGVDEFSTGSPGGDGVLSTTGTLNCLPQITCPQSTSVCGLDGVPVTLSVSVSDPDPSQTLTLTLKEGSHVLDTKSASTPATNLLVAFDSVVLSATPHALHALTVEVTDGIDTNSCTTSVTVDVDTDSPTPVLPTLPTIRGQCAASVDTVPTATDDCAGPINGTTIDPRSYSTQGTFTIHWTFDDGHGNTTTQTQTVFVQDTLAPVPEMTILPTITGQCSATVTNVPTAIDACAGRISGTTTDPRSYSTQGTFTIHWTYDDGHGNTTIQTQTVTVQNTLAPTITACPPNQSANATNPTGAVVNYPAATASDDNCAPPTLSYSQAAGTLFPVGDTMVTVTATDATGHQVTRTFNVHVKGATEQLSDLMAYVAALSIDSATKVSLQAKLTAAKSALASGNRQDALGTLKDFIDATSAVKGKKLSAAQANRLISDATRIRAVIGG